MNDKGSENKEFLSELGKCVAGVLGIVTIGAGALVAKYFTKNWCFIK